MISDSRSSLNQPSRGACCLVHSTFDQSFTTALPCGGCFRTYVRTHDNTAQISQGPDESEHGGRPLQPVRRTPRRDCTQVAEALLLGVKDNNDNDNADNGNNVGSRRASQARGHVPRWLGGNAEKKDEQER